MTAAAMLRVAALDRWPCSCKGLSKVLFPPSLWPKWVRGSGAWRRCRPAGEAGPGGRLGLSEAINEECILSPPPSHVHSFSVRVRKGSRARGGGCGNLGTTLPLRRAPGVPTWTWGPVVASGLSGKRGRVEPSPPWRLGVSSRDAQGPQWSAEKAGAARTVVTMTIT